MFDLLEESFNDVVVVTNVSATPIIIASGIIVGTTNVVTLCFQIKPCIIVDFSRLVSQMTVYLYKYI